MFTDADPLPSRASACDRRGRRPEEYLSFALVAAVWAAVLLLAYSSLHQPLHHDAAFFYYLAFLIDRLHLVPYRDFFDVNLPGTYVVNILAERVFGFSDLGYRCADLTYLVGLIAVAFALLRRHGRQVAAAGAGLFALYYLALGSYNAFQREYLLLLPVALAAWLAAAVEWRRYHLRAALIGFLFGCAVTLKPQAILGLPPVLLYLLLQPRLFPSAWGGLSSPPRERGLESPRHAVAAMIGLALAGFLLPLAALAGWLWHSGALPYFLHVVTHDWPLYAQLNVAPRHIPLEQPEHTWFVLRNLAFFGGVFLLLAPAALGAWAGLYSAGPSRERRYSVYLLIALALAFWVYVGFSQFWLYHWIPAFFFVIGLGALCLARLPEDFSGLARLVPPLVLIVAVACTWRPPVGFAEGLHGHPIRPESADRVAVMTDYLRTHLQPGDTVQALDWTGGAIEAMLHAQGRPATPILCDCSLAHHVHSPYMRTQRAVFMQELARARPRIVLEVVGAYKPMVSGPDVSYDFPELRAFLAANYAVAVQGQDYVIYQGKW